MSLWESRQWLGKNIIWNTGKKNLRNREKAYFYKQAGPCDKSYHGCYVEKFNFDKKKILSSEKE